MGPFHDIYFVTKEEFQSHYEPAARLTFQHGSGLGASLLTRVTDVKWTRGAQSRFAMPLRPRKEVEECHLPVGQEAEEEAPPTPSVLNNRNKWSS